MSGDHGRAESTPSGLRRTVFLSYRRADSSAETGRLATDLRRYLGRDQVYLDIDSNVSARDYVRQLEEALATSRAVIAVIGPGWLDCRDEAGGVRLADPGDLVRRELEAALRSGVPLVPVLVRGATMPTARQLPSTLRTLATIQALKLPHEDWDYGFKRLLEDLAGYGVVPAPEPGAAPPGRLTPFTLARYQRTLKGTRHAVFNAVVGAVEQLRYPIVEVDEDGARVRFRAHRVRPVEAVVLDAESGRSTVALEVPTIKVSAMAGASLLFVTSLGPFALAGVPAVALLQRKFAAGFLDNVQLVLHGRGVGPDSSLFPGINAGRQPGREV
ncbi:toll/interleukin-1 receptor domain-containing protein [Streptomyces alkaliphilus]|uniref:toll/interleukin-1 receptor domain-containing protein n=1 Tax=Streptomyces alkaliphilus TaxID=1472722 RepID=UPI001180F98A|nr:toll/interleukin-1 receptor domain-containing protein [Streptomyces alkaliphilus]MQS08037.1 TIR domain-containing protein [Streptomyces alkaliphilus]